MKKQGGILILAVLLALILCGTASAAENSSTTGGKGNLWVNINYEYDDDDINPEISVTDSHNNYVAFNKTKKSNTFYNLKFTYAGVTKGTQFKVTTQTPGYKNQTQKITINEDLNGYATFNMKATKNYKLGRQVTAKAIQLLGLSGTSAKDVLVITTAGITQRDGTTTEDCVEGILNGLNGKVSFGQGNLLTLRKTSVDPVDFAFIKKSGGALEAVFFLNGSTTPSYQGSISQNMTAATWNKLIAKIGGTNAFTYASLANAWKAGAPADLLREAAFHGHMCQGTISGYAMSQVLMMYYPPLQDTSNPGSPYDVSAYKVICVPGDSDDDAIMNLLNTTPGKGALAGYDTTESGSTSNMVGFIRWVDTTKTGDLIVMKFNKDELREQYLASGKTLNNDLDELKFNTWVLGIIKNKQYLQLVTFIREFKCLNEEQYYTLVGSASDIKNPDGSVRITARDALGLNMTYINSLGLKKATKNVSTDSATGTLTPGQIKQIGVNAANLAKKIFLNEKGIDLEKDSRNLVVQTTASYVYLNGQLTDMAMDGVYEVLGSRLTRKTLLPMHVAPWKILYFCFTLRGADGETMDSLYMTYNGTSFLVGSGSDCKKINNIGPAALNNNSQLTNLKNNVFKDGGFFGNIQSIANAWRVNPRYDQLVTFLFHDHACPGVQPGFFITDMVFKNFQLSPDEEYYYMAASIYCKDDSLVYLMGVSPGMGSYMNQRLIDEETASEFLPGGTEEGILVIWDKKNNIGRAIIINFKWPELDNTGLTTSEAIRENSIHYFVNSYNNLPYDRTITPYTQATSDFRWITAEELAIIKKGGLEGYSALAFVKGISADRTRADLIQVPGGSETGGSETGGSETGGSTDTGTSTGTGSSSDGSNSFPSGSVGVTGATVSAATETTTPSEGDSGKAYEITETGPVGTDDTPWTSYAVVGILSVLVLAGIGFFFKGSLLNR